jgi:dTDP-4-dehydrorhamnose 3,5-epimerase-like enzyme
MNTIDAHDKYTSDVNEGIWPKDSIVPLPNPFIDERGVIQNLLLKPITSVASIISKKGTISANHYHTTDWHYAFVVAGIVWYFEREIGDKTIGSPQIFGSGEMFFTPPMKEHAMVFMEDSQIITFAKNIRDHEHHEADLVRVPYITPEHILEMLKV